MVRILLKRLLFLIIGTFFSMSAYSTAQKPDLLIIKEDTLPLFSNPLEAYFDSLGTRNIRGIECNVTASNCWRGYQAIWRLRKDSLFLDKVRACSDYGCPDTADLTADLEAMFGTTEVFAKWYSDTLIIPKGERVQYIHMGYASLYEKERHIKIGDGIRKNDTIIHNKEMVEQAREKDKIRTLKDRAKPKVFHYLQRRIRMKDFYHGVLFGDTLTCDAYRYRFFFDSDGHIDDVEMLVPFEDPKAKFVVKLVASKCCRFLEGAVEPLTFASWDIPQGGFHFDLHLNYDEKRGRFETPIELKNQ